MKRTSNQSGLLLGQARRRCGLTQQQLAVRAGTSQAAISRIERGVESPTVDRLSELLATVGMELALDVRPMAMWADEGDVAHERLMTPAQRLEQGLRLAEFATELAAAAADPISDLGDDHRR